MKVTLNIQDDQELRASIKDAIRGQVLSIVREELTQTIKDEFKRKLIAMEVVLLKRKSDSKAPDEKFVVFDEIIKGIITSEYFIPAFTGSEKGLKLIPLSYLIDNYRFPIKEGKMKANFLYFMSGARPELINRVEFYESEELEIETL